MGIINKGVEEDRVRVHESKKREVKVEGGGKQLLPGILNEVTLDYVAPKLPWTAFHVLSSVSRGWQQAIQSHQVYDARVRSQSTETLVVLEGYRLPIGYQIILYSLKDGSCYYHPAEPPIPWEYGCVSLDGKLYILGGLSSDLKYQPIGDVYMLDLAGQRQWQKCASMEDPRTRFGCGVINEKIYVFAGSSGYMPVCGSEVYNPKEDAWSPIMPMRSFRFEHKVTRVGEELFAYNGRVFNSDIFDLDPNQVYGSGCDYDDDPPSDYFHDSDTAEVYHPLKDEWRCVEHFTQSPREAMLMLGGKLHKATPLGIHFYDIYANSWQLSQSFSFDVIGPRDTFSWDVVAVGDELFAEEVHRTKRRATSGGDCHMISEGLGVENKEIVWQKAQGLGSLPYEKFMCLIQL